MEDYNRRGESAILIVILLLVLKLFFSVSDMKEREESLTQESTGKSRGSVLLFLLIFSIRESVSSKM